MKDSLYFSRYFIARELTPRIFQYPSVNLWLMMFLFSIDFSEYCLLTNSPYRIGLLTKSTSCTPVDSKKNISQAGLFKWNQRIGNRIKSSSRLHLNNRPPSTNASNNYSGILTTKLPCHTSFHFHTGKALPWNRTYDNKRGYLMKLVSNCQFPFCA